MKRHLWPVGVEAHDKKTHVCKLKKTLYELRRHPWDNTYMRSLVKILNFDTRLIKDAKFTDGCKKNAFKYRGSWYPVTLDGYIEY